MDNKFAVSLVIVSVLALFLLAGCSSQQTQAPAQQGSPQQPVFPGSEGVQPSAQPIVPPNAQGGYVGSPTSPDTNSVEEAPVPAPSTPTEQENTDPANSTGPTRIGVDLPPDPAAGNVRFIVEVPASTPANSIIYLETYDVNGSVWRMYQMSKDEYLGWNVELDLATSGGVEDGSFHYRYSRDGKGYETAEKLGPWEMPNAYRTRALEEISGKDVPDKVTEWRDV
ncbi:MAG: hypothetical protein Q7T16_04750 [Candidatus Burarchaeum sp.]|nr:hypothetical protein [Candidatus Burarchaeum sp.]MDO8339938.1 hypothetical protein [Candidatus Burarchaeum sp.]